ncbi:sugar transferase [Pseudodesulfovibrio piezophilus]|uniref:Exopolysaccharide biosynthesis polyprenyl glycosylphosphotransferase n=1 Tax=Pseudodesulfovibrio piezophilus (strain DSM 21447 / JCM 15486 / C1TLV30) TaxID=1322246 RepID=M1WN13_PSEP2|nr:sugar transferase [Pseudodesulfovibrio piezophilus]CCH50105.1 Exopolysaccharide biosynthesis polyprenyl glycosylphosphotransferase [Pseudodesulfovibrio piezophilus C1TLV30]
MYKEQVYVTTNVALILDGLVIIMAGYGAYYIRWLIGAPNWVMDGGLFTSIVLSLMFINCFVLGQLGFYTSHFNPPFSIALGKCAVAVSIDFSLLTLGMFFVKEEEISRIFIGSYAAMVFAGTMFVRFLFHAFLRKDANAYSMRRILLVGNHARVKAVAEAFHRQTSWGHCIVGWLSVNGSEPVEDIPHLGDATIFSDIAVEKDIDEVVFALPPSLPFDFQSRLDICKKMGLTCRIVPAMFTPGEERWGIRIDSIDNVPALSIAGTTINATGLFYKRILDIIGGAAGFLIFCLIYIPVAIAIRMESPGPILFSQVRVGQNNRKFKLFKFRSMFLDAEARKRELMAHNEMDGHMFKMKNDPRITKVGKFLRKTSLDEFPQFINVMRGEMSLVGTRPPTVDEVSHYEKWERRRISMKPGVTGLWQVSGRNKINKFEDVVRMDLDYIDGWRFMRDVRILLKTIWVILNKDGAS